MVMPIVWETVASDGTCIDRCREDGIVQARVVVS